MTFYEIINFSGATKARIFAELTWPYLIQLRKPGPSPRSGIFEVHLQSLIALPAKSASCFGVGERTSKPPQRTAQSRVFGVRILYLMSGGEKHV
jgi:hypothetical protein